MLIIIDVALKRCHQSGVVARVHSDPVGLRTAIKSPAHAPHFLWHFKVANAYFAQVIVHILAKTVEKALPKALQGVSRSQTVQHQRKMQHDHVETAVNRVGDRIVAVKAWQSRLRHDHAIQGRNGGRLSVAAK